MKTASLLTRGLLAATLLFAGVTMGVAQQGQQQPPAKQPSAVIAQTHLKVGDEAPDFTLPDNNRQRVKLSDFRGKKNVVLAFYVLAFTGG